MCDEERNDGYDVGMDAETLAKIKIISLGMYRIIYTYDDGILGYEALSKDLLGCPYWHAIDTPSWDFVNKLTLLLIDEYMEKDKELPNLNEYSAGNLRSALSPATVPGGITQTLGDRDANDAIAQIIWGKMQSEIKAAKIPPPGAPVPVLNTKKVKKTKKTKRK